jgi:two-component system cell cycle sensor histidine kinase/response regulator CckA
METGETRQQVQKSICVLVVDDDELLRSLAADILSEAGYTVYQAASGEDAIDVFRTTPEIVLVITDMGLPGIGGDEVVRRVREINPETKSLAMSGFGGDEMLQKVKASEAAKFIAKPFDRGEFLKLVGSIIGSPSPPSGFDGLNR